MLIKYPDNQFQTALNKSLAPIYFISGKDEFLLNECVTTIKSAWHATHPDADTKRLTLEHISDWYGLIEEASAYSLFHSSILIHATTSKKRLDNEIQALLQAYATNPNLQTLIIITAPQLALKTYIKFCEPLGIQLITIQPLSPAAEKQWIINQLKAEGLTYSDQQIPALIQAYTSGYLFAAAQVIERLSLFYATSQTEVTLDDVREQCINTRDIALYEVSNACLLGETKKAISLVRQAKKNQAEPVLILWYLTEELRKLEQIKVGISHQALNIYSFRAQNYKQAEKRLSRKRILSLLQQCQTIDEMIKTSTTQNVWLAIEALILGFSSEKSEA